MVYQCFAASCSAMPAFSMTSTKGWELPSMIGISGPLISMRQLSTPIPTNAARTCSTVLTFTPLSSSVVPLEVSVTRSQSALITGSPGKSTRLNWKPNPALAGCSTMSTKMPVCKPVPEMLIEVLSVCCLSGLNFKLIRLKLAAKINHFSQVEYGYNILKINF